VVELATAAFAYMYILAILPANFQVRLYTQDFRIGRVNLREPGAVGPNSARSLSISGNARVKIYHHVHANDAIQTVVTYSDVGDTAGYFS